MTKKIAALILKEINNIKLIKNQKLIDELNSNKKIINLKKVLARPLFSIRRTPIILQQYKQFLFHHHSWAYQALAILVETYFTVKAGYPNGTFRGNRAMTRYEAAALLNACLDRVTSN